MREIGVFVPATSGNLGPGFDVMGMTLNIFNEVHFSIPDDERLSIQIEGEGCEQIPGDESNLIYQAVARGLKLVKMPVPNLHLRQINRIPLNRGLGSSASAVLAGLMIASKLSGGKLTGQDILRLGVEMEGHPDNIVTAYRGGIVITYPDKNGYRGVKFMPAGPLTAMIAIPDVEVSTRSAREILPEKYDRSDVVFNIRSVALVTYALSSGKFELLPMALKDRIHQPYRSKLIPWFDEAVKLTESAGALGTVISGSGSTIISLCAGREKEVASALKTAIENAGVNFEIRAVKVSRKGAHYQLENK